MNFLLLLLLFLAPSSLSLVPLPPTEPPLIPHHPFVAVWNAPTDRCRLLEIPLDTAAFQAVTTPAAMPGQFLTIFYEECLGLYPKVDVDRKKLRRGGIPQDGNLTEHLSLAKAQIHRYIAEDSAPGLAVIDWESWRPLWDQNWGSKRIYQKLSITHALQVAPFLSSDRIAELAKSHFQQSGRRFMERTISLGVGERPSRRWGFYLFPDCHNYKWNSSGYTGRCSATTRQQNDQMMWLWERSSALFPSVYLHPSLRNSPKAKLFVQNRVQEAVRVSMLPRRPYTVPIYVYARPLYRDQNQVFLSQADLVNTVGESAALGASGVVMWGGSKDYNNKASCHSLSDYLSSTFNPYVANVTAAAILCSDVLCQGRGRCVRKSSASSAYLHLSGATFSVQRAQRRYVAVGLPAAKDLKAWEENFTCQCFAGSSCSPKLAPPTTIRVIWV